MTAILHDHDVKLYIHGLKLLQPFTPGALLLYSFFKITVKNGVSALQPQPSLLIQPFVKIYIKL